MKILRCSMYPPDLSFPTTMVIKESSLRVSIEEAVKDLREHSPGAFFVDDIFEAPDDTSDLHATFLGLKRLKDSARATEERNMAISYYWNAAQLTRLNPEGVLANPSPAPLCADQIKSILLQLKLHPNYKGQVIMCFSRDGEPVCLQRDGRVVLFPKP